MTQVFEAGIKLCAFCVFLFAKGGGVALPTSAYLYVRRLETTSRPLCVLFSHVFFYMFSFICSLLTCYLCICSRVLFPRFARPILCLCETPVFSMTLSEGASMSPFYQGLFIITFSCLSNCSKVSLVLKIPNMEMISDTYFWAQGQQPRNTIQSLLVRQTWYGAAH